MLDERLAARQLAFLERVVQATAEQADHDQLLRRIIDEATEATDTQVCSLYLWDDAEKVLILTATNGLAQSGVGAVRLGLGEGVTGRLTGGADICLTERDWLVTLPRPQGGLVYLVFVSPERDFNQLHPTYQKMLDSLQLQ